MYINKIDFGPTREQLDQCIQVLINDEKMIEPPHKMKRWAMKHCQSYVWMEEVDVSDTSPRWDYLYAFYFLEEKDALMFQLKYKH